MCDDRKEVKDVQEDQQKKKQRYDRKGFRVNDGETTRRMRESLSGQSEDCLSIHGGLYTQTSVFVPVCTLVCAHWSVHIHQTLSQLMASICRVLSDGNVHQTLMSF